jgi:hypothetical protein
MEAKETLENYIIRLKQRRDEDNYSYTNDDFIRNKRYIKNCYKKDLSVYKCLEFMFFENNK